MPEKQGPVAQLVRAPPCHGGGRRFESDLGRFFIERADVAQLAEQLICNQQVIGSSPIIGFLFFYNYIARGGAVRKLVGLITRRS